MENIDLNTSLTPLEKAHTYDRVLGFKLGTTDPELWHQGDPSASETEVKKELRQKEEFDQYREILKTWVQYFNRMDQKTTGKLKALLDEYGMDALKKQITRYADIGAMGMEPSKILDLIEQWLNYQTKCSQ